MNRKVRRGKEQPAQVENVISGRQPVLEALQAGSTIQRILLLEGTHGSIINEIQKTAAERNVPVVVVEKTDFLAAAGAGVTQGVAAIIPERTYHDLQSLLRRGEADRMPGFILVLDGIEDPHNLGALIRSAECAGADGVIIPKHHAASITGTVVKASAGATEHIAIAEVTNTVNALQRLKEAGYWVVGLDGSGDKTYTELDYSSNIALVIGSEGKGIRRLVKEHCDFLVRIDLYGNVGSLNASVAGGLAMFEVARKRRLHL